MLVGPIFIFGSFCIAALTSVHSYCRLAASPIDVQNYNREVNSY